jgi:hypothetical protein
VSGELAAYARHCRQMSNATHWPDCTGLTGHPPRRVTPDPACHGCVTESGRALWTLLAAEAEAYGRRSVPL